MRTDINHSKQQLADAFFQRLVDSYGYLPEQMEFNVAVSPTSVADIAIWRSPDDKKSGLAPDIYVLVACKAEHIKIKAEDYFEQYKQAVLNDMAFYVAHNLKETKVFYIDRNARPLKIERISDFPTALDIVSDQNLALFVNKVRGYSKDKFLKTLTRCHNIIRNVDKLSPEAAFDEISKILFIKMLYERDAKDELVYSKDKFLKDELLYNGDVDYIQHLFNEVKETYSTDGLFDSEDKIRIRRESFLLILEELSSVELYDTSDDIKGIAFELFLGKTFRGELGQFFTPRTIVNYMVEVLNVKEGDKVCDPCCGSGGFLIKAFEHVQNQIDQDIHKQITVLMDNQSLADSEKQYKINTLLSECDKTKEGSRYHKLCHDYFFGVDANARMARTSKMNMIMHGDGHVGVYLHDGLINVGGVYDNNFDVILINPPFGAHVEKDMRITSSDIPIDREKVLYEELFGSEYISKVYTPIKEYAQEIGKDKKIGKRILELYQINNNSTEILFIERCINLLKPGKRAGIVLPEGVLDNPALDRVRRFIESRAKILNITSIPADVFLSSGANIKPSLVFIEKFKDGEIQEKDYLLSVTKVNDAGISSTGLPSNNEELPIAAKEVASWLSGEVQSNMIYTKIVNRSDLSSWSVKSIFDTTSINYNPLYKKVRIGNVVSLNKDIICVEPNIEYTRLTVKLFNKGIQERDTVMGALIGTKRQTRVKGGQFIISKIDGKSAAFGIVDSSLEGAIVTPDFLVYDIDTTQILPEYLELVLTNDAILNQFSNSSSGTTGRRRLSQKVFENTLIALPSIDEQRNLLAKILEIRETQKSLEEQMQINIEYFNNKIFS
ncbi:N-6 DNA methylase [Parabacteroides johnsonii]|uniref:N-6 DNA methylase n=1 Tax=Parabacteroides johnsonii TaxID=387661 RepID=UPI00248D650A|nr:N-6 DNA methylase [Parabacteroides johnsonii]